MRAGDFAFGLRILLGVAAIPVQVVGRKFSEEATRLVRDDLAVTARARGVRQA